MVTLNMFLHLCIVQVASISSPQTFLIPLASVTESQLINVRGCKGRSVWS
jgi:hypothetical protein